MTRTRRTFRAIGRTIPIAAATLVLCAPGHSLGHAAAPPPCQQATARPDDPRRVPLEPTGPAIGAAGYMTLAYARSPYGVAVTDDGRPVHKVRVVIQRLFPEPGRDYVVWAATPTLDRVVKLGVIAPTNGTASGAEAGGRAAGGLDAGAPDPGSGAAGGLDAGAAVASGSKAADLAVTGRVAWNRFMVVVTAERDTAVDRWRGPVLLTAVSPSNWMHTMRGHGIFARAGRYC